MLGIDDLMMCSGADLYRYYRLSFPLQTTMDGIYITEIEYIGNGISYPQTAAPASSITAKNELFSSKNVAFDKSTSSGQWHDGTPSWITIDFGATTPVEATAVAITIGPMGGDPNMFSVECSHDNATWVTRLARSGVTWTSSNQRQVFNFTA
ncbi:discoidin domain-containing protein [Azospirillum sp. INR13]|uniref:discoidin domain-containing protein n=1 Tax=Azospirillum sp. INR13 TaxID=2596919 RepID=UPI00189242F7|nr:discoidin domain-containing protein [Azospirillum sp. INR13]MBF5094399.1 discoidin domain-containing protein [Azospirillum sp. INR13]